MCSACCSVEKGDNNKEGKQLNFIQHDAGLLSLYCTARTRKAQSPTTISTKAPVPTALSAKSKFWRRRPWLSFIKPRTAVLLLQHVYTHTVWHHSRSQPQLTSQFRSGSANQFSHKLGQPALKPVRL